MSGSPKAPLDTAQVELRVHDLFVNVEGLRVRVPKPLLGFIPFGASKEFGLYAVMRLAAPDSSEPRLLLDLAREALGEEFAPISRNSPDDWHIKEIACRQAGAAPPMLRHPGCVDQDWGALWYEIGDEAARRDRYALAKTRLWDEDFKVPRPPSVPILAKHEPEVS